MNAPVALLDTMISIPPQRGKTLSQKELQEHSLAENDPVYDQARNARLAKLAVLSMSEHMRRKSLEEQCIYQQFMVERKDYVPRYCHGIMDTGQVGEDAGPSEFEMRLNR